MATRDLHVTNSCPNLVRKPHPAFCRLQYPCVESLSRSYLCASSVLSLGNYKIGKLYRCVCMPRDTLPVVLYSLGQGGFRLGRGSSWLSHLLEELFTHGQLQDVSPGWGIPQAQIPLVASSSELQVKIHMLNFASGGLLTYFWRFCESSPVQSSPPQSSD